MAFDISRLGAGDFEEAIDFLNMVFSMYEQPTSFTNLLPVYYQPTDRHMQAHHVIRSGGKIRAMVGVYPGTMVVGNKTLRVARIGAVSSHPSYRGQGMMKALMEHCMEVVKQEKYDLGFLGGYRHRYLHFGFEKCGHKIVHHVNMSNIKHCGIPTDAVDIRSADGEDNDLIAYFKSLYDSQPLRYDRTQNEFYSICLNWKNRLYGIYKQGTPVGYLVAGPGGNRIAEIHTENLDITIEAIAAYAAYSGKGEAVLAVNPLDLRLHHRLGRLSEGTATEGVENWRVLNWESVLSAFLSVKHDSVPLTEGRLTLGIEGDGNLVLSVAGGDAVCMPTLESAVLRMDPAVAARALFGPLPPSFVIDVPKEAEVLNNWCPLPLFASPQDFA